jgi:cytochrome c biogenesis protein CcmG/thiol:disulfide interchange protein DsbE
MPMKRLRLFIPIAVFVVLVIAFGFGLRRDPSRIPPTLIDQPAPSFELASVREGGPGFSSADLEGKVSLVNIFASWCVACVYEHPTLVDIAEAGGPAIYGLAWKDEPGATAQWLDRLGDPYTATGDDASGRVAIDFGVTGAPETYVVDKTGHVRYKHVGVITPQDWRNTIGPLVAELELE